MSWYYRYEGRTHGPVSDEELDAIVIQGMLNADSFIWQKGMPSWVHYREVRTPPEPRAESVERTASKAQPLPSFHPGGDLGAASADGSWYYSANGQAIGPLTQSELDALLQSRQIVGETPVWRVGMVTWQSYHAARSQTRA